MFLSIFFFLLMSIDLADNIFDIIGVGKYVCKQEVNYNIMIKPVVGVVFESLKII